MTKAELTKRRIAAALEEPAEGRDAPFIIKLVPQAEIDRPTVILHLKTGATKNQAADLQAQLNLLAVDMQVSTDT